MTGVRYVTAGGVYYDLASGYLGVMPIAYFKCGSQKTKIFSAEALLNDIERYDGIRINHATEQEVSLIESTRKELIE